MGKSLEFKDLKEFQAGYKKINWQFLVYRNEPIFLDSILMKGYAAKSSYKKLFNINFSWDNEINANYNLIHDLDLLKKLAEIGESYPNKKIIESLRKCYVYGDELISYSMRIKNLKLNRLENKELLKILGNFENKLKYFSVYVIFPMWAYNYPLEHKLTNFLKKKGVKKIDEYLRILVYPTKKNVGFYEQANLFKMALKIKNNKKLWVLFNRRFEKNTVEKISKTELIISEIKKHIEKFGWIQCRNYQGNPWSVEEMIKRIKVVLPDVNKAAKGLYALESKMKKDFLRINGEIKFGSPILELVKTAKELVYYKTFRTDIIHESGFNIRNLLVEIGERFNYSYEDMLNMSVEEIENLEKEKISRNDLEERKKGFVIAMIKGKMNYFWGKDLIRFKKLLVDKANVKSTISEIKGVIANKGIARGVVRIVKDVKDIAKVKKGDILVTPMTFPSFIPAMEKASAFVTDEGGILCHAAIVSREMNKPCIINTKNSTKVLKDGYLVSVDANEGVIKILKKN